MSNLSRLSPQQRISHYRELASIAIDRASAKAEMRADYLDLARSWNALADHVEDEHGAASSLCGCAARP